MANLKGLYDKIASLVKSSDVVAPDGYTPVASDLVAVYDSTGPVSGDNIVAPKKFVSVTDIGTGGGGGGSMSSFNAQGAGGVLVSIGGGTYETGPVTVTDAETLFVSAQSVPNGLNWRGSFSAPTGSNTNFDINDVVYTNSGSPAVYKTWFAIQGQAISGAVAPPTNTDFSNAYWALLGTQGPAGSTGATGPAGNPGSSVLGFRTISANDEIRANAAYGVVSPVPNVNDRGVTILVSAGSDITITIPYDLNLTTFNGFPANYQVSIINTTAYKVTIVPGTSGSNTVTLYSADNARNLRTQYSGCTLVRNAANVWYMFGDLTNIA